MVWCVGGDGVTCAEMELRMGRDGALCGRRWCSSWVEMAWHMGRDSMACGRKWCGMWVEMARFVGVKMGRRVGRDGLAWGSAEGVWFVGGD